MTPIHSTTSMEKQPMTTPSRTERMTPTTAPGGRARRRPSARWSRLLLVGLAGALLLPVAALADDDDDHEDDRRDGWGLAREHHRGPSGHHQHEHEHEHERHRHGRGDGEASGGERGPGDGRGGRRATASWAALRATPEWATYSSECGSCHLAYSPSMLPARSWSTLLRSLDQHFGENAELDTTTRETLERWLSANAGRDVGTINGQAPTRITELPWWRREHHEVDPTVYRRTSILTPANCGACHPGANEGAFDEHQVEIPRDAPLAR